MRKILKMSLKLSFAIAILLIFGNSASAHPPSQTEFPYLGHFDIYGKITAPDGTIIRFPADARVTAKSSEVIGQVMPRHCLLSTESFSPIDPNTGEYHLIFFIDTTKPECRENFNKPPILLDKIKLINAPGYDLKIKNK
ncbi:hypothetical protein TAGGR_1758 [Thermodesulfovibrio aggregans]|uniref:Uncharacterized protein n=1 Tax=Thermodesulfovibrio aggregans TaxID=86166 RepID=A0A0U9HNB0_9BACT|nr:hypothetical protein [Thermodesulfovibrio aggregans]GAQ94574.1 hypothetical protein TAGGR_1758 [Thermodesulfovibrio aggregans]